MPVIEAIPLQMIQLFTNLISNALKFGKKNEPLEINIHAAVVLKEELAMRKIAGNAVYYKIEVRDNGIGFEQENADKIFTIFQRLHGRAEYDGTGIGLAICKKIVQNHYGAIYADAAVNAGACFTIFLPETQVNK